MSSFCTKCGQALPNGASFCMTCGTMVAKSSPTGAPAPTAASTPAPTPQNHGAPLGQAPIGGQGGHGHQTGFGTQGGQGNFGTQPGQAGFGGQPNYGAQPNPGGFNGQGGYTPQQQQAYQRQNYGGPTAGRYQPEPGPLDYMFMPLKKYVQFSGRSRRSEYWWFFLFSALGYMILGVMLGIGIATMDPYANEMPVIGTIGLILMVFWALALFLPTIAVSVRRFHDQNQSGWLYLLILIPYLGAFIILIFMFIDGTRGPNNYGPDPKDGGAGDIFQ